MPRIHCPSPLLAGAALALPAGPARHVQVLRLQPGDTLTLFNGEGLDGAAVTVRSDVANLQDVPAGFRQPNTSRSGPAPGPGEATDTPFVTRATQELCAERAMQCVGFPEYPPSDDRAFSAAGVPGRGEYWKVNAAVNRAWDTTSSVAWKSASVS